MGRTLCFDTEADGLLDKATRIHCAVIIDADTGEEWQYRPDEVSHAVEQLAEADMIVAHNALGYDVPLIQKFYPDFRPPRVLCTLAASRTSYAGKALRVKDLRRQQRGQWLDLKPGSHALEAWGIRLGERKLVAPARWEHFSEPMLGYCTQDTRVLRHLFQFLIPERVSLQAALLETRFDRFCRDMEERGAPFDEAAAHELLAELADERQALTVELRSAFPARWLAKGKLVVPKRSQQSRKYRPGEIGYRNVAEGCPYQAIELVEFNPASGDHIARELSAKYGWKPKAWTDSGKPETSDRVLSDLQYAEAPSLARYQRVKKIIGMLADGDKAWLKLVKDDGRLHGRTNHIGTVPHRVSHDGPNLGQVPSRSPLGKRCRALFVPSPGHVLVGADASGLQLRMLGHYLGAYDGGAFAEACQRPKPNDIHEFMRQASGWHTRDNQKNGTYGWLFGAGDRKLGLQAIADARLAVEMGMDVKIPRLSEARRLGAEFRAKMESNIVGLSVIQRNLKRAARRGWLRGLDGRRVEILSLRVALNTLLMSGEAVVMKMATLMACDALADEIARGVTAPILYVHDETQWDTEPEAAEYVGKTFVACLQKAGRELNLRCPLDGEYLIGKNWKETH